MITKYITESGIRKIKLFQRLLFANLFFLTLSSTVLAWNAALFVANEEDPYGHNTLLREHMNTDEWWTEYHNPISNEPTAPPAQFYDITLSECRQFCSHNPYPFSTVEDCHKICTNRNGSYTFCTMNCAMDHEPFANITKCVDYCDKDEEYTIPTIDVKVWRGHNWLTNYAIYKLRQVGLWEGNISDADLKYIHYGLTFADSPWLGRPDARDAYEDYVIGIWDMEEDDLRHRNFTDDDYYVSESEYYRTEVQWEGGTFQNWDSKERANLYLMARQYATMADVHERTPADNFFHFRSGTVKLRTHVNLFDGDPVFDNGDVGAGKYGTLLYQLARKFWPQSTSYPNINELPRIYSSLDPNSKGKDKTGEILLDHCGGSADHIERAQFPSLYLGGNPFVCSPVAGTPPVTNPEKLKTTDLCRYGRPTWPVWVPADAEYIPPSSRIFEYRNGDENDPSKNTDCFYTSNCENKLTRECIRNSECVDRFHQALENPRPKKDPAPALIYLGWAVHMIQDLAMPLHAANWNGKIHRKLEKLADQMIKHGYGDKGGYTDWDTLDSQISQIFAPGKSRREICGDLNLDNYNDLEDSNILALYEEVAQDSLSPDNYEDIEDLALYEEEVKDALGNVYKQKNADNIMNRRLIQRAFQRAILGTMKLLACFNYEECQGTLEFHSHTNPNTYRSETILSSVPVYKGYTTTFNASQKIVLSHGFKAGSGANFVAKITPCYSTIATPITDI